MSPPNSQLSHPPADYVTIVSGLPRSGTSMMMRMLEAGGMPVITDSHRPADDDNPLGYYEFEPAKRTRHDASWVARAGGHAVKMIYRLLYDLPAGHPYRVLLMRRRMAEVLSSQRQMLSRLAAASPIDDDEMGRLLSAELAACERWLTERPHFRVLAVDYNRLVAEPHTCAPEINAFLDHRLDPLAMARVVDPRLYRQRKE